MRAQILRQQKNLNYNFFRNFRKMLQKADLIFNAFTYAIRETLPSKCVKKVLFKFNIKLGENDPLIWLYGYFPESNMVIIQIFKILYIF